MKEILPDVGGRMLAKFDSKVDFPLPFSPVTSNISPDFKEKLNLSKMIFPPRMEDKFDTIK